MFPQRFNNTRFMGHSLKKYCKKGQRLGTKRMKDIGSIEIPQDAFMSILDTESND